MLTLWLTAAPRLRGTFQGMAGKDATEAYLAIHNPENLEKQFADYRIGRVTEAQQARL